MTQRKVRKMVRLLAVAVSCIALGGIAFAQSTAPASPARPTSTPPPPSPQNSVAPPPANPAAPQSSVPTGTLPSPSAGSLQENFPAPKPPAEVMGELPPLPDGKSTVLGGEIREINPVLDQFTLRIFGGGSMKILFDERTQIFRNGERIPVLDLRPSDHASVETTLVGSTVYALRIHILSQLPEGTTQGQVLSYDPQSGRLTISPSLSQQPITLIVPADTPVTRVGEDVFTAGRRGAADLAPGALVAVEFVSNGAGMGKATHVNVLATPGASFLFAGVLSYLSVPRGELDILDPRDGQHYQVTFEPARFPISSQLHPGEHVRVAASFDGQRYTATSITIE